MVKLLTRRWWGFAGMNTYAFTCPNGCGEYYASAHVIEGCAEFIDVSCGNCGAVIGRMRDDWGGDRVLQSEDLIPCE